MADLVAGVALASELTPDAWVWTVRLVVADLAAVEALARVGRLVWAVTSEVADLAAAENVSVGVNEVVQLRSTYTRQPSSPGVPSYSPACLETFSAEKPPTGEKLSSPALKSKPVKTSANCTRKNSHVCYSPPLPLGPSQVEEPILSMMSKMRERGVRCVVVEGSAKEHVKSSLLSLYEVSKWPQEDDAPRVMMTDGGWRMVDGVVGGWQASLVDISVQDERATLTTLVMCRDGVTSAVRRSNCRSGVLVEEVEESRKSAGFCAALDPERAHFRSLPSATESLLTEGATVRLTNSH